MPCNDVPLTLRSIEFDAVVASWGEAGRIEAPAGLRTDLRGELRLEGLPHGTYDWSVTLPDGRLLEGTLSVLPGQLVRVPVVVAP